jgi:hypothetical protein
MNLFSTRSGTSARTTASSLGVGTAALCIGHVHVAGEDGQVGQQHAGEGEAAQRVDQLEPIGRRHGTQALRGPGQGGGQRPVESFEVAPLCAASSFLAGDNVGVGCAVQVGE